MREITKLFITEKCNERVNIPLHTILCQYENDPALYYECKYYLRNKSEIMETRKFTLNELSDCDLELKEISIKDAFEYMAKNRYDCEFTVNINDAIVSLTDPSYSTYDNAVFGFIEESNRHYKLTFITFDDRFKLYSLTNYVVVRYDNQ